MSKNVKDNKRSYSSSANEVNRNISAIDNVGNDALTSSPTAGTDVKLKKASQYNLTKALIQIMYERGEINSATYEKSMKKLIMEVDKNEKRK